MCEYIKTLVRSTKSRRCWKKKVSRSASGPRLATSSGSSSCSPRVPMASAAFWMSDTACWTKLAPAAQPIWKSAMAPARLPTTGRTATDRDAAMPLVAWRPDKKGRICMLPMYPAARPIGSRAVPLNQAQLSGASVASISSSSALSVRVQFSQKCEGPCTWTNSRWTWNCKVQATMFRRNLRGSLPPFADMTRRSRYGRISAIGLFSELHTLPNNETSQSSTRATSTCCDCLFKKAAIMPGHSFSTVPRTIRTSRFNADWSREWYLCSWSRLWRPTRRWKAVRSFPVASRSSATMWLRFRLKSQRGFQTDRQMRTRFKRSRFRISA
mmetsp:Transcript_65528/g.152183  ORF Transcript_65528/g.152183 Transcript_65528/m.152183 type:complete len:326 (+) Transcript_65528:72-1049(+)